MKPVPRRSERHEFHDFPWVFSLRLSEPAADRPLRVEARNISRNGMKFVTNRKIPLFEEVQVALFSKEDGRELATLFGKVVRVEEVDVGAEERTYGIALDFLSGADALAKLIPESAEDAGE